MICVKNEVFWKLQGDMTDEAFARRLGVSRSQLWRIRTKKASVGAEFLEKFMLCFPKLIINDYFFASDVASAPRLSLDETVSESCSSIKTNKYFTNVVVNPCSTSV